MDAFGEGLALSSVSAWLTARPWVLLLALADGLAVALSPEDALSPLLPEDEEGDGLAVGVFCFWTGT